MRLPIVTNPSKILHQKAEVINPADLALPKIKKLIANMIETMYSADGVGLAAPQINESIQLCVIAKEYSALGKNEDLVLVNPVWQKKSILAVWDAEGCLSVPEYWGEVKRYKKIKVKALDQFGRPIEFEAKDFPARVIQHEVDHLNGILFVEKARNLKKNEPGKD